MHDVSVVDLILGGKKEPNWYTNEGKLEWEDLEERATPLHSPATAYVWNVPQPQPMRLRHLQEILEKRQSSSSLGYCCVCMECQSCCSQTGPQESSLTTQLMGIPQAENGEAHQSLMSSWLFLSLWALLCKIIISSLKPL